MANEEKKPLYMQIFEHYRQKIINKELLPDDQLPTVMGWRDIRCGRITTKKLWKSWKGGLYTGRGVR